MTNDRIWTLLTRKLSGEASATELQELDLLLQQFPDALKTAEDVAAVWAMNEATDHDFLEATYLLHLERMNARGVEWSHQKEEPGDTEGEALQEGKKIKKLKQLMVPAGIILLLGCFWAFLPMLKKTTTPQPSTVAAPLKEIIIPNGSRTKILLPDGSNVWLNSGSKLQYKNVFDKAEREVFLTGEAFFDVVKDAGRPFIIHTSSIEIKVLGTRFNVKAYQNDQTIETSLIRGAVEVFLRSNPQKKYLLKPNEKLVLVHTQEPTRELNPEKAGYQPPIPVVQIKKLSYIKGTSTDIESSWTKNILSFEDEVFTAVAHKMERWYDVTFVFENKKWEDFYLNGSFEKESLEQAMTALRFTTGFEFKITGKNVMIY